jgi:hypothetical protein
MMETFALINDKNQVVNHVVVDKDAPDFESVMQSLFEYWNCVRYVETTNDDEIVIHLDEDPEIWTTHTEEEGFILPSTPKPTVEEPLIRVNPEFEVLIKGKRYPKDSLLIKENASLRPNDWVLPEGIEEVSLADKED